MLTRRALAAVTLLASACGSSPQTTELRKAVADGAAQHTSQGVAFRFAGRRGADVRLYQLPSLSEVSWRFNTPNLVAAQVVGLASDDDLVYALTPDAELAALDLESGRARTADSLVARAVVGPDGTVRLARRDATLAIVSGRRVTALGQAAGGAVEAIVAAAGDRMLVVTRGETGRQVAVAAGGALGEPRALPDGLLAVAPWGDAVAVATDTGLVVTNTMRDEPVRHVRVRGRVTALAFSSSGHRLYAATDRPEIVVIERFELERLARIRLPEALLEVRADPFGAWLLGRGAEGLVLVSQEGGEARPVEGSWGDDLPAAGPDGTVLVRRGGDVVALDAETLEPAGRVRDAAADRWLIAEWDPRRPALQLATPADGGEGTAPAGQEIYVQVSSTSNRQWADDLARDLRLAGMRSAVLAPTPPEEMFRVVIGPYETREAAEETGRKLGMPYWIFTRGAARGTP